MLTIEMSEVQFHFSLFFCTGVQWAACKSGPLQSRPLRQALPWPPGWSPESDCLSTSFNILVSNNDGFSLAHWDLLIICWVYFPFHSIISLMPTTNQTQGMQNESEKPLFFLSSFMPPNIWTNATKDFGGGGVGESWANRSLTHLHKKFTINS